MSPENCCRSNSFTVPKPLRTVYYYICITLCSTSADRNIIEIDCILWLLCMIDLYKHRLHTKRRTTTCTNNWHFSHACTPQFRVLQSAVPPLVKQCIFHVDLSGSSDPKNATELLRHATGFHYIYISKDMARAPLKEPSLFLGLSIDICIYIYAFGNQWKNDRGGAGLSLVIGLCCGCGIHSRTVQALSVLSGFRLVCVKYDELLPRLKQRPKPLWR